MRLWVASGLLALLSAHLPAACPCSFCPGNMQTHTLREDAALAKLVLYGTLANPRLNADNAVLGGGSTDLAIDKVLKSSPFLGERKVITIPRYVPIDARNPPRFLVFCDVFKDKDNKDALDPYRGLPVKAPELVDYLQGALALDPQDRSQALLFYFNHLEHPAGEIAADAFLELAKASDQEIGQAAHKFSAAKLRAWLQNEQTPVNRLGLYGFLLGACGSDKDAVLLQALLENPSERTLNALDGILCGYIELRPREGWELVESFLRDEKKPFSQRFAVLRTMRFFHGWKPEDTRRAIVRGLNSAVAQGDIADLAVEDLRRWRIWDLTEEVLAQYGKKSHDVPIVRRGIVRYALSCPRPEASRFIDNLRKQDPEIVRDVEESLQYEKK